MPFGLRQGDLDAEVERRARRAERQLAPKRRRLQQAKRIAAEWGHFLTLLEAETQRLEDEQRELLRQLSDLGAEPTETLPPELLTLSHTLIHYRTLHQQLVQQVHDLLAPYLQAPTAPSKEDTRWPSIRSEER